MVIWFTCNAPQRPRLSRHSSRLACSLWSDILLFWRPILSSVFMLSVDKHCLYHKNSKFCKGLFGWNQICQFQPNTKKYLVLYLLKFCRINSMRGRWVVTIIIYINFRRCHKLLQFSLVFNRTYLWDVGKMGQKLATKILKADENENPFT